MLLLMLLLCYLLLLVCFLLLCLNNFEDNVLGCLIRKDEVCGSNVFYVVRMLRFVYISVF